MISSENCKESLIKHTNVAVTSNSRKPRMIYNIKAAVRLDWVLWQIPHNFAMFVMSICGFLLLFSTQLQFYNTIWHVCHLADRHYVEFQILKEELSLIGACFHMERASVWQLGEIGSKNEEIDLAYRCVLLQHSF